MNYSSFYQELSHISLSGNAFVLAVVVFGEAGSPGRSGFKMLVGADGTLCGTVGGGALEYAVIEAARQLFITGGTKLINLELTPEGNGMNCGGSCSVFLEHHPAQRRVIIYGAGHVGRALAKILAVVGIYTVVNDDRNSLAADTKANEQFCKDYTEFATHYHFGLNDAVVIATHGHEHDYDILKVLANRKINLKYLGLIGSRKKLAGVHDMLTPELNSVLHAPIGLGIAREKAEEIALAIAAEVVAVYNEVDSVDFLYKSVKKY